MTETKRKRNTRTFKATGGFRISSEPVVRLAADDRGQNIGAIELPHAYGPPTLFAIARDSSCIFAGWNIDWLSVFEKTMPVNRQVYLRIYHADGLEQKSVAAEPMATTHYITISEPQGSYRLDIGYYQPADVWHSVAMSNEIVMPPCTIAETAEVDLVTIPFHLSFQQLIDSFGASNNTTLTTVMSRFQKHASSSKDRAELSAKQEEILGKLDLSLSDIEAAHRAFEEADNQKLASYTGALLAFGPSSPSRGFEEWASAAS